MHGRHLMTSFLILLGSLVVPLLTYAETKILTAEATYIMGDGETPSFAEAMVLQKAKQMALEQAGTYVESYTKIKNYDLSHEEIQTIAGGVLEVEVLEKTRALVGDGLRFYVKIKATVTTDKMEELAQRIKGKNIAQEYEQLRNDYASLTTEIEALKALIAKTPPGPEREAALRQIREREGVFVEGQTKEAAFFRRLIAGETLIREAEDEQSTIARMVQTIKDHGHVIQVGKPMGAIPIGEKEAKPTVELQEAIQRAERLKSAMMAGLQTGDWMKLSPREKERRLRSLLLKILGPGEFAKLKPDDLQGVTEVWDLIAKSGPEKRQALIKFIQEFSEEIGERLQRQFRVKVPVRLTLSDNVAAAVRGLAQSLGGTLYAAPATGTADYPSLRYVVPLAVIGKMLSYKMLFAENREPTENSTDMWLTKYYLDQRVSGTFLAVSRHYETNYHLSQRIRRLVLTIRLKFDDGGQLSCMVPYVVNRILPGVVVVLEDRIYHTKEAFFVASFENVGLGFAVLYDARTHKGVSNTEYVALLADPISFEVEFDISEKKTKGITEVEAKYEEVDSLENLKIDDVCQTFFRPL